MMIANTASICNHSNYHIRLYSWHTSLHAAIHMVLFFLRELSTSWNMWADSETQIVLVCMGCHSFYSEHLIKFSLHKQQHEFTQWSHPISYIYVPFYQDINTALTSLTTFFYLNNSTFSTLIARFYFFVFFVVCLFFRGGFVCCVLLFVMSFFLSYFSLFCFALSFLIKHTYSISYLNKILYSKILHFLLFYYYLFICYYYVYFLLIKQNIKNMIWYYIIHLIN